ncbi:MAG: hypothetical protein IEMM0008_1927 [bacterium]|nr:MAG: hypothetical protein IEMM0008_1927 [bacterium]
MLTFFRIPLAGFLKPLMTLVIVVSLCIIPDLTHACSVCGANDVNYRGMIIFMTILPFSVLGLIIWWIVRQNKKMLRKDQETQ